MPLPSELACPASAPPHRVGQIAQTWIERPVLSNLRKPTQARDTGQAGTAQTAWNSRERVGAITHPADAPEPSCSAIQIRSQVYEKIVWS